MEAFFIEKVMMLTTRQKIRGQREETKQEVNM